MIEKKNPASTVITYILLAALTVVTLLPLVWMVSASLKPDIDVFSVPIQWVPKNPMWSNYTTIWSKIPFALFTWNSMKLSVLITLIQVTVSSFAAYGFTKCNFKGRDILFFAYIATIAIPWQVYMLPQYTELRIMNLGDSHTGYILIQSFLAFGVYLMRQFYQNIPNELMEAARIDGLNEYGIYFKIVLPLSKPVIATLSIYWFVRIWNDFMGPMIYFDSESNKTIPLGIRMFIGQYSTEYGLLMASSVVSLIPVIIVFLAFQRFFVQGIATSGMKN
ncbi:MAG: carbohydrate ABC transporter permease [Clostridiales bacterium]|jgi:multiple sugar transport system permease protein|nr:carbohydrate ABC transporter permease [Clostridiales bacterium]